ncbi:glutaredoxin 3 [Moraxella sp. Tifton1]|uniref:Glutaredoxin n=1 Tax=Moraxella oculi TaxID=2940516 RepID=A0ABW8UAG1_9GAMM|nr:glutaredoxin 3 [Moraxella sp. Tifton1]MCL1623613.1 glutaredoxin 3 [Moraxella sp. Tifton1]
MTQVSLYIKEECPYCKAAIQLLHDKGIKYTAISVYDMRPDERNELALRTNNHRTVPQIFIGETFIGGFDQLNKLNRNGELDTMLGA